MSRNSPMRTKASKVASPPAARCNVYAIAPWPHQYKSRRREQIALLLQLAATAVVLGWLPGNFAKLAAMIGIWAIGFGRISRRELILFMAVSVLFSLLDMAALQSGAFKFRHPDLLGLPIYEFFMWGFFTLHALRFVGKVPATRQLWLSIALAVVFAVPFATLADPFALFAASSVMLIATLAIFRDSVDFAYTGYMIAIGSLIEYVGVWTGQWAYPNAPPGGVALWFIPMWGGVGLFTGRLLAAPIGHRMPPDSYSAGARSSVDE